MINNTLIIRNQNRVEQISSSVALRLHIQQSQKLKYILEVEIFIQISGKCGNIILVEFYIVLFGYKSTDLKFLWVDSKYVQHLAQRMGKTKQNYSSQLARRCELRTSDLTHSRRNQMFTLTSVKHLGNSSLRDILLQIHGTLKIGRILRFFS